MLGTPATHPLTLSASLTLRPLIWAERPSKPSFCLFTLSWFCNHLLASEVGNLAQWLQPLLSQDEAQDRKDSLLSTPVGLKVPLDIKASLRAAGKRRAAVAFSNSSLCRAIQNLLVQIYLGVTKLKLASTESLSYDLKNIFQKE